MCIKNPTRIASRRVGLVLGKGKSQKSQESLALVIPLHNYTHLLRRSGLLTFFSSLVIQECLINFAGERLRSKKDSHCDMYPESWTHFLIKLNTWMFPCIEQGASILFFLEFFCYCNNLYILPQLFEIP